MRVCVFRENKPEKAFVADKRVLALAARVLKSVKLPVHWISSFLFLLLLLSITSIIYNNLADIFFSTSDSTRVPLLGRSFLALTIISLSTPNLRQQPA